MTIDMCHKVSTHLYIMKYVRFGGGKILRLYIVNVALEECDKVDNDRSVW